VAAIADDIAYDAHDIDDGLRAGILDPGELRSVPFLAESLREIDAMHPGLDESRRIHELSRRVITRLVEDVLDESATRLWELAPGSADDIRRAGRAVIGFSPRMSEADASIKAFLFPKLYRHPRLMTVRQDAETIVRDLFETFSRDPTLMPEEWRREGGDPARRAADYIAGMTDRYAILEHRRLFASTPSLRIA
jgi:dGTPase